MKDGPNFCGLLIISELYVINLDVPHHSAYRKNNNIEKYAGIGLNGFIFKNINEN